ncbi:hypothetical protein AB8O38_09865, partial [Saccharomonospora xinjiangensis]|uniref:hypothetical protein n=1 Tax=Saccharomonospora xinjiangensis TaxID=75294 RepID=UPI00350EDEE3
GPGRSAADPWFTGGLGDRPHAADRLSLRGRDRRPAPPEAADARDGGRGAPLPGHSWIEQTAPNSAER